MRHADTIIIEPVGAIVLALAAIAIGYTRRKLIGARDAGGALASTVKLACVSVEAVLWFIVAAVAGDFGVCETCLIVTEPIGRFFVDLARQIFFT